MKKIISLITLILVSGFGVAQASSTQLYINNETFQSGAVFNGNVGFSDNTYSQAISVNGTLTGGGYGTVIMDWIWDNGVNYASAPDYGTFLMNGTNNSNYNLWNNFTINTNTLTFADNKGYGNSIEGFNFNVDMRTGGTITVTPPAAVPVPAAIWMFGSGLLGLGAFRKKFQAQPSMPAIA